MIRFRLYIIKRGRRAVIFFVVETRVFFFFYVERGLHVISRRAEEYR